MFVFSAICILFGLSHLHGGSGDGGATRKFMTHPQFRESSPAIPGVRQLFKEVHAGLLHGGRTSYLPAERRSPAALLDGAGGEVVRDAKGTLYHCSCAN